MTQTQLLHHAVAHEFRPRAALPVTLPEIPHRQPQVWRQKAPWEAFSVIRLITLAA